MRLWVAATIIALIILVGFIISVPHTRDIPNEKPAAEAPATVPTISVRDIYRKGVHTLTGSVLAPDPCTTLSASAELSGTTTSQSILVTLTMPQDTGVCLEQATPLPFSTTVTAPADLPLTVVLNGSAAAVNPL